LEEERRGEEKGSGEEASGRGQKNVA